MAVEQAMLDGSFRLKNQNFERADRTTLGSSTAGGAKENPFEYDEE